MNTIPTREIENKRNVLLEADLVPGQVLLEPRAVLRACVAPSDFESPLSVIDFGAGTIDAAYLEKGHVEDFVTFLGSGDALTRRIQAECRTDFSEAEQIKINSGRDEIRYTDLGGETRWISRDDLERIILPVLKEQVFQLKEWFENRTPDLVFLAGGGSQFQFVDRLVSRLLGVDESDVISGLPRMPSHCVDERNLVRSPSDFTALGMLLLIEEGRSRRYLRLNVNGTPYARLIDDETFTVEELCERLGYAPREPDPDSAIMISLDGEWETFRSSARLEPRVRVDGERVTGEYELRSGDDVEISPPEEPQPMELRAGDCLPDETLEVVFEGRKMEIPPCLLGDDGNKLSHNRLLRDGEEYRRITTFTVDRVIEHVRSELGTAPDVPLWKIEGKYFDRSEFEVGETVDLEGGISVDSVGLGNLSDLPEENIPISSKLN